ncbi:MFS transporter [Oxalobacteraceae bacterium CAVE-383]|nr:MFS transporter [Oxalobacteraceae bacterium CAVE-383]
MQTSADKKDRTHWLPYLVAATFFMEYLDTTVIATALPQMARSFNVGPNEISLGMTAYMLALAVFIPVSGWVADRYGSRTVFGGAIVVFTVASILCGLSDGVLEFTIARVLQGIGGAMMVPVGRLIVVRNTEKSKLMQAIATITWPAIAAPVIGPPIGGFITTYATWRWIFLLNVPFGIAALVAVIMLVRNERGAERKPLDVGGFLLSGAALTSILYGTELASQTDSNVPVALAFLLAGGVFGFLTWHHAARREHPLIDFSTMKVPTFSVTVLTGSFTRIGIGAVPYLMPLLFQIGFGMSAFTSGLLLLASAMGNLSMKAGVMPVLKRFGFRRVSIVAVTCAGLMTIACGFMTASTPLPVILVIIFGYGLARSMQFSTLAILAYADIPPPLMNPASTLWSASSQMMIGMGIAFGAVSLRFADYLHGGAGAASANTNGEPFAMADFRLAFILAGIVTLLSVLGYVGLERDAGAGIGGASRAKS